MAVEPTKAEIEQMDELLITIVDALEKKYDNFRDLATSAHLAISTAHRWTNEPPRTIRLSPPTLTTLIRVCNAAGLSIEISPDNP